MKKSKITLNQELWNSLEEFYQFLEIYDEMPKKRIRDFPIKIHLEKWLSLCSVAKSIYYRKKKGKVIRIRLGKKKRNAIKTANRENLLRMPYKEYLMSDYWRSLRNIALNNSGHACQLCKSPYYLNVHHRSYENRGGAHKELKDLIVLCKKCHEKFHDIS